MSRLTRDGTAEPVSRDQILRHERGQGNIHFPCSADHEQDWQPYPVDPYSATCDDHTYILYPSICHELHQVSAHGTGCSWRLCRWSSLGGPPQENANSGLGGLHSSIPPHSYSSCGLLEDAKPSATVEIGIGQARSESSGSAAACGCLVVHVCGMEHYLLPKEAYFHFSKSHFPLIVGNGQQQQKFGRDLRRLGFGKSINIEEKMGRKALLIVKTDRSEGNTEWRVANNRNCQLNCKGYCQHAHIIQVPIVGVGMLIGLW